MTLFSLHNDYLPNDIGRQAAKGVLPPVFKDQINGFRQVLPALLNRSALPIRSGNLRTISDKPFSILFDDCCKFVAHAFLRLYSARLQQRLNFRNV